MATSLSAQLLLKGVQGIEIFTGADDQDPTTWLQGVEELFDCTKLSKDDRRTYLPMYFGDDIKKWYRSEQHSQDYDSFKEQFLTTFTSSGDKLKIYSKLTNRRQRPDETVQSYHYDILSLCSKFNEKMLESEKILHLLHGLKPSLLQQVMMADPETCKDFLEQAKRAEAAAAITQSQAADTTTTTDLVEETTAALRRTTINNNNNNQQFRQQPQNFNQRGSQQKYNNNQIRRQRQGGLSNLVCYNCNGVGHYAYQCPSHLN